VAAMAAKLCMNMRALTAERERALATRPRVRERAEGDDGSGIRKLRCGTGQVCEQTSLTLS
jgi:hypothetical protein